MADTKPRMTQDLILPPGVVLTPDHEVPARSEPGATFADRPLFVREDTDARYAELSRFQKAEIADVNVLGLAEPSLNDGPAASAAEDAAYAKQQSAQRERAAARTADKA